MHNSGQYTLDGYEVSLHCVSKPEESRSHYFRFDLANKINPVESYNLLCGRAVLKDNIWLQFDLCDKDVNNNYRVKEFHLTFDYDLVKILQTLPVQYKSDALLQNMKMRSKEDQQESNTVHKGMKSS